MSPTSRRKDSSIIWRLVNEPFQFSFAQAVRLLERFNALQKPGSQTFARNPVARFLPSASEAVRFSTRQTLSFSSSEIASISTTSQKTSMKQWQMQVNFIGITGSNGVMPFHYSELALERIKQKDTTIEDFFDLFNHRVISLFYQASIKYRFHIEYERRRLFPVPGVETDNQTQLLLSLIGLGTQRLTKRQHVYDESLLYYTGLLAHRVRNASGLKQIIQNYFNIPVQIQEFIGQWQELINDVRTRLPGFENPRGQNNCLGNSVMLGRKGWFAQGKFRIILGPLTHQQLHTFAPGTATLRALDEIVRFYINFEHDYEFVMQIHRHHIPSRITLNRKSSPVMGWNTWLATDPNAISDTQQVMDIPVSSRRFK